MKTHSPQRGSPPSSAAGVPLKSTRDARARRPGKSGNGESRETTEQFSSHIHDTRREFGARKPLPHVPTYVTARSSRTKPRDGKSGNSILTIHFSASSREALHGVRKGRIHGKCTHIIACRTVALHHKRKLWLDVAHLAGVISRCHHSEKLFGSTLARKESPKWQWHHKDSHPRFFYH